MIWPIFFIQYSNDTLKNETMPLPFITKLEHYLKVVPRHFKSILPNDISQRPAPKKWSKKEIMGHLIDSAVNNLQRFTTIVFSPQPFVLTPYQQNELVAVNRYQDQSVESLLSLWSSLNQQIVQVWKNYSKDELALLIKYSEQELPVSLLWWIEDYTKHLEHHLKQIFGPLDVLEDAPNWHTSIAKAKNALTKLGDQPFVELLKEGTMLVEYYAPHQVDLQQPHRQDELYVIQSGSGVFYNNGNRSPFVAGDVLFVPAGIEHRFEDFTDDFATWVIFYGPDGGEKKVTPIFEANKKIGSTNFMISTNPNRLDVPMLFEFLTNSYWGKGRDFELIKHSISRSLNVGLYAEDRQIGFARVVSDEMTFAYLADVFVIDEFRGKGLGKWLIDTILKLENFHPEINWLLGTKDAHGLYEQFGFSVTKRTERIMEKRYEDA